MLLSQATCSLALAVGQEVDQVYGLLHEQGGALVSPRFSGRSARRSRRLPSSPRVLAYVSAGLSPASDLAVASGFPFPLLPRGFDRLLRVYVGGSGALVKNLNSADGPDVGSAVLLPV
jgi:hypothetical protein